MKTHQYGIEIYPGILFGVCSFKWEGVKGFYIYFPLVAFYYKIFTS